MLNQFAKLKLKKVIALHTVLVALAMFGTACTKSRNPEVKDQDLDKGLIAISELKGEYSAELAASPEKGAAVSDKSLSASQISKFKVAKAQLHPKINLALDKITLGGQAGEQMQIVIDLQVQNGAGRLTALKKVTDKNAVTKLSALQTQIARVADQNTVLIPVFSIKISKAGVLVRKKNDNKEETSELILEETELSRATHVKLDFSSIAEVKTSVDKIDDSREVLSIEGLDNRVSTVGEINQILQTDIGFSSNQLQRQVVTKIAASDSLSGLGSTKILVYDIKKIADIKDNKILDIIKNKNNSQLAMACSDDIKAQLPAAYKNDCYLVQVSRVAASFVKAELRTENGIATDTIDFKPSENGTGLIRVSKNSVPELMNLESNRELENICNSRNCFAISQLKNKEFFLRRTIESTSSTAAFVHSPGLSDGGELIKFEFTADRMIARSAVNKGGGSEESREREVLITFAAEYLKTKNSEGEALATPIKATPDQADYVKINFLDENSKASLLRLPLMTNGCVKDSSNIVVTDVDNRLQNGILNFSVDGSFQTNPACAQRWRNGAMIKFSGNLAQYTFDIKERISFKANDGSKDNLENQDIPLQAQSVLGFGVFTSSRLKQDEYGRLNRLNTEIALPNIQDFTNGRQITYVVGGLDEQEPRIGAMVEQATRAVIDDWNKKLRMAFKGTHLERTGDYIVMKVDGRDIPKGHLGDIDRFYIWNFPKSHEGNILGVAQALINPRSGYIESSNVLMPVGNLVSYIRRQMETSQIKAKYEKMKADTFAELTKQDKMSPIEAVLALLPKPSDSDTATPMSVAAKSDDSNTPVTALASNGESMQTRLVQANKNKTVDTNLSLSNLKNAHPEKLVSQNYLFRIIDKVINSKVEDVRLLTAEEILASYGDQLNETQMDLLQSHIFNLHMQKEFQKNFSTNILCMKINDTMAEASVDAKASTTNFETLFLDQYATTLSHELGHTLGLTHNFKGSTDKENFEFAGEQTGRLFSSVMDYIPPEADMFSGAGPYDVHAVRAAYAGYVEGNGRLVKINDIKKIVSGAASSWWRVDDSATAKLQGTFKPYKYCNDYDVDLDPMCNRHDLGTTPDEVAQYYIDRHKNDYPIINDRGIRLNYNAFNAIPDYVSRVREIFIKLLSFSNAAFYELAINGEKSEKFSEFNDATLLAIKHLLMVATSMDTSADIWSPQRFSVTKINAPVIKNGRLAGLNKIDYLIERKQRATQYVPGSLFEVQTIGYEIDKVLAWYVLAAKRNGNPKYRDMNNMLSMAEYESFISAKGAEINSIIIAAIRNAITGNVVHFADTEHAPVPLSEDFKEPESADVLGEVMKIATLVMDNSGVVNQFNIGRTFYLRSTSRGPAPADAPVVTSLESSNDSARALKIWPAEGSAVAEGMVAEAATIRYLIEHVNDLKNEQFEKLMTMDLSNKEEFVKVAQGYTEFLTNLQKEKKISLYSDQAFWRGEQFLTKVIIAILVNRQQAEILRQKLSSDYAEAVKKANLDNIKDEAAKIDAINKIPGIASITKFVISRAMVNMSMENPLVIAFAALSPDQEKDGNVRAFLRLVNPKPEIFKSRYSVIQKRLEIMSSLTSMLHPELLSQ